MNDNPRSRITPSHPEKAKQPSPNEVRFGEVVKALLAENHTHHNLKQQLHKHVMEEARNLPRVKVLYCTSYGSFAVSTGFRAFLDSRSIRTYPREDPALIQAISDYGRSLCDRFHFILEDARAVYTLKLDKLFSRLMNVFRSECPELEFNPDLVAEATSFIAQMSNARDDSLGSFRVPERSIFGDRKEVGLVAFIDMHPDFWMAYYSVGSRPSTFEAAFRFAHALLRGAERARYLVERDEAQDAAIYEYVGLYGARTSFSHLAIEEIPALVDYWIHEYDGMETVEY